MSLTWDQVKKDISSGKSPRIYYSSGTLWWTHLAIDVEEATKMGKAAAAKRHNAFMDREDIPESEKQKRDGLYKGVVNSNIPLDPTGAPLLFTDKTSKWAEKIASNPGHFGKHGLDAFMKAHHQNCNERVASTWAIYNEMIDDGN